MSNTTRFNIPKPSIGSELMSQVITELASALDTIDTNVPKWVWGIAPTGVKDGANKDFTLPGSHLPMSGILLTFNGQGLTLTRDYTLTDLALHMVSIAPNDALNDALLLYYPY